MYGQDNRVLSFNSDPVVPTMWPTMSFRSSRTARSSVGNTERRQGPPRNSNVFDCTVLSQESGWMEGEPGRQLAPLQQVWFTDGSPIKPVRLPAHQNNFVSFRCAQVD